MKKSKECSVDEGSSPQGARIVRHLLRAGPAQRRVRYSPAGTPWAYSGWKDQPCVVIVACDAGSLLQTHRPRRLSAGCPRTRRLGRWRWSSARACAFASAGWWRDARPSARALALHGADRYAQVLHGPLGARQTSLGPGPAERAWVCVRQPLAESRDIVHLSHQKPGSFRVLGCCKSVMLRGRRSTIARTPIFTASVSSAAKAICHGADGMSWVAGNTPSRMRRCRRRRSACGAPPRRR